VNWGGSRGKIFSGREENARMLGVMKAIEY
jgi:hypothetical protein